MNRNTPVANIEVVDEFLMRMELLTSDKSVYPVEMQYIPGTAGLAEFINGRVTPRGRQGLAMDLQKCGYSGYSIPAILIASNGRDCSDPFWIRFETGPQTWEEVWAAVGVHRE